MTAQLEHLNYTVSDPAATAAWMHDIFGWKIRWEGDSVAGGHSKHVGTDTQYVAIYGPKQASSSSENSYDVKGGLNHIAVVVDDLDAVEEAVKRHGFEVGDHHDYEPGRRFYFEDADGIEYEVVQYD